MRVHKLVRMAVLVAGVCTAIALQAQRGKAEWVVLGERVVTDRGDHDSINVTAGRGAFEAIKFEVKNHAVDFHRVVVHFGNGDDQNIDLRATIPAGGESRVIDIDGVNRVIKSIDFWYDAKTLGRGGRAVVRSLGRH